MDKNLTSLTRRDVLTGSVAVAGSAAIAVAVRRGDALLPVRAQIAGAQDARGPAGFGVANQHSTDQAAITAENVGQLGFAWGIETQEHVSHWPLLDQGQLYFADWGGKVYAADAETGQMIWEKQVQESVMTQWPWYGFAGSGTVGEGMLFEASVEGMAYALDPETGEVVWSTDFATDEHAGNLSKLLYHDGLLYIGVSSVEEVLDSMVPNFEPDFQGRVVALNASDGSLVWDRQLVEAPQTGVAVWSSFTLDPDTNTLFFTTSNNYTQPASELSDAMVAVDATTGEIRWANQVTQHDVWTTENRIGPDYAFGAGPQLFEGTTDTGQTVALVGAGQKSGIYYAFDRATGDIVWTTVVGYGGFGGGIHAEASIGDGTIFVWSNNSYEYGAPPEQFPLNVKALDASTGANVWVKHHAQPAAVPAAGFLANNVYFVGSLDGVIRGYRASDGEQVWTSGQHPSIASALVAVDDALYFTAGIPKNFGGTSSMNGVFAYALNAEGTPPAAPAASPAATPAG